MPLWSNGFWPAGAVELKVSRGLVAAVGSIHVLAGGLLIWVVDGWLTVAALLILALSLAWQTWQLLGSARVTQLQRMAEDQWRYVTASGRRYDGQTLENAFVHPRVIILSLRQGWRRRHVVLLQDSLTQDNHRRLRVLLRWG